MNERWPGSLFQTLEATDENDLDLAISVFRVGTHSDNEEEDRSDRVGAYHVAQKAQNQCYNEHYFTIDPKISVIMNTISLLTPKSVL